jgi:hypothetical protein
MWGVSQRSRSLTLWGFLQFDAIMTFLRLRLTPASAGTSSRPKISPAFSIDVPFLPSGAEHACRQSGLTRDPVRRRSRRPDGAGVDRIGGIAPPREAPIGVVSVGTVLGKRQAASLIGWSGAGPAYGPQRLRRPSSPACATPSSRAKKLGCRRPPLTLRPDGAGRPFRRLQDRHRGRTGRLRKQSGETTWHRSAASPATRPAPTPE